ncbi:MAG: helix-turn-helix domain-containing protein [Chloroflexota bacterium]
MTRTTERIVQAAVDLHGTIGPAATTMSAVADRAGVTRATLYRHFPNEEVLVATCSADWLAANPRPDMAAWTAIVDPVERLAIALTELYGYYRATQQMRANLLRDISVLPAAIQAGIRGFPVAVVSVLDADWPSSSDSGIGRAIISHAVAFETWRSLANGGLTDRDIAALMVGLVESAQSYRAP